MRILMQTLLIMLNADHHKLDIICNAAIAYVCSSTSILATHKKIAKEVNLQPLWEIGQNILSVAVKLSVHDINDHTLWHAVERFWHATVQKLLSISVAISTPNGIHEYTKINVKLEDHIDRNINELTIAQNNYRGRNFLNLKNQYLQSSTNCPLVKLKFWDHVIEKKNKVYDKIWDPKK
jgi:hypothetical protein